MGKQEIKYLLHVKIFFEDETEEPISETFEFKTDKSRKETIQELEEKSKKDGVKIQWATAEVEAIYQAILNTLEVLPKEKLKDYVRPTKKRKKK
tara:strand:- start:716 stop:997 length:282 start_codon:yes stop_codon:yes gene_type:complete